MWTPDTYISNAGRSNAPSAPKPHKSTRVTNIKKLQQGKYKKFLDLQIGTHCSKVETKFDHLLSVEPIIVSI